MDLSHKQWQAWEYLDDRTHTEVLYGGAAGGGKSWLGALWLLTNCLRYPGTRWLMGRAVGKTLKETTLQSFFDVCSLHSLKAGTHYAYNQQTGVIAIGTSTILLKDLFAYPADPNFDELGSLELTGAFIDEANQVSEKAKMIVGTRIRYRLNDFGLMPKLLMTCNPAKNWVFNQFYGPSVSGSIAPHRAFVPALVTDNPNIAKEYVESLEKLPPGPERERLLLGNWDYDDDPARLMGHDAILSLWTNDHVPEGSKCIVADVARYGSDKTVISLWEGLRLVHLTVMEKSGVPETAAAIISLARTEGVQRSRIVIDDDGIGGGVVDLLPGCYAFKGGAKPIEQKGKDQEFQNLKSQCCFVLADYVNGGDIYIATEAHQAEIQQELGHVKRDRVDEDKKLKVLGKDKVKESLGRSPDFADVMMMRMIFELRGSDTLTTYLSRNGQRIQQTQRKESFKRVFHGHHHRH